MKKIILLAFISMVKPAETSIQDSTLLENFPDYVHPLGNFLIETRKVIEFGIKLEDQLLGVKSYMEKKLSEHKDDTQTNLTYIRLQLETQLDEFKSFFEERLAKEVDPVKFSNLKKEITEELNNLKDPFNKRLVGDFAELPDVDEFKKKFEDQLKKLNNFLDELTSKSPDSFEKSEFGEKFEQKLKEFEKNLNLLSKEDRVKKSKVFEFLTEIKKLSDELLKFLDKNKFNDQFKSSEVRKYGLEVEKQLANILKVLKDCSNGDFKDQPEILELMNEFDNKLAGVFMFLEENSIDDEKIHVLEEENRKKIMRITENNDSRSAELSPRSMSEEPMTIKDRLTQELQSENTLSGSQNATSPISQTQPKSTIQHHVNGELTSQNSLSRDAQELTRATGAKDVHKTQFINTKTTSSVLPKFQNSISNLTTNVRSTPDEQLTILAHQLSFEPKPFVANGIGPTAKSSNKNETLESLNDIKEKNIQESLTQDIISNHMLQGDDPGLVGDSDLAENIHLRSVDENYNRSSSTMLYDKIEERKLKNKRDNSKKGYKNENDMFKKSGLVILRDDKQNNNPLVATGLPRNKYKNDKSLTRKSRNANKDVKDLKHDSYKRNLDNLGDDPNLYSYEDRGLNDVYVRPVYKDKEKINSENNKFDTSLPANKDHNNLKKIVSEGIIENSKIPIINDHTSLENKTKSVNGKQQSFLNKNNHISNKTETYLDLINPRLTLNFTISRRIR